MNLNIYNTIISLLKIKLPYFNEQQYVNKDIYLGEDGLQMDSLLFLQLLTDIEKGFNIVIEDDFWSIKKMSSVYVIVDYIESRITRNEV